MGNNYVREREFAEIAQNLLDWTEEVEEPKKPPTPQASEQQLGVSKSQEMHKQAKPSDTPAKK